MESCSDPAAIALRKCPFLAKVAAQNGTEYARGVALCPTEPVGEQKLPQGQDAEAALMRSFALFHGPSGVVPLVRAHDSAAAVSGCPFHAQQERHVADGGVKCKPPITRPLPLATISLSFGSGPNFGDLLRKHLQNKQHGSRRQPSHRQRQPQQPAGSSSSNQGPTGPPGSSSASHPSSNPSNPGAFKPQRPLTDPCTGGGSGSSGLRTGFGGGHGPQPPAAASSASTAMPSGPGVQPGSSSAGPAFTSSTGQGWPTVSSSSGSGLNTFNSTSTSMSSSSASPFKTPASGSTSSANSGSSSGAARSGSTQGSAARGSGRPPGGSNTPNRPTGTGGSSRVAGGAGSSTAGSPHCPLRKWLGPMAGLVFNEYDKLICPPPIVAARAALAKTAAVQQLRPQKLPVKLVAVAAVAAATNMPCGAVREHFEKFSLGWFIAVHATIPFVAMLRKAVVMPKYAMLVTFAAAVMGQVIGSRLERARLQQLQQQGLPDPLTSWVSKPATHLEAPPAAAAAAAAGNSMPSGRGRRARGESWRQQILAGGRAGFAGVEQQAATVTGACSGDVGAVVVGLGCMLPQLPVVRA